MTAMIALVTSDFELADSIFGAVRELSGCAIQAVHPEEVEDIPALVAADICAVFVHCRATGDQPLTEAFLREARRCRRRLPVVVISESPRPVQHLAWFQLGALDCLARPLDLGRVAFLVESLSQRTRPDTSHHDEPSWLRVEGVADYCCASECTREMIAMARKVANCSSNLLIVGETGTGKSHLARVVHGLSKLRKAPFVAVNCAAVPESLVESELFGHRRGSFTGADRDQSGKFADAGEGTLFLDEIETLALSVQGKLLHAVEDRQFLPIGSSQPARFQGRLIAASNEDLEELVEVGRLRSDLFFRLSVLQLEIAPLRNRREEILELADGFIHKIAARHGRRVGELTLAARQRLLEHDWPGNVRELHNVLERAVVFAEDNAKIGPDDLRLGGSRESAGKRSVSPGAATLPGTRACCTPDCNEVSLSAVAEDYPDSDERRKIAELLLRNGNNRAKAAREMGISRTAFYKKLRKHGLTDLIPGVPNGHVRVSDRSVVSVPD